jgi:hypothetical protein
LLFRHRPHDPEQPDVQVLKRDELSLNRFGIPKSGCI